MGDVFQRQGEFAFKKSAQKELFFDNCYVMDGGLSVKQETQVHVGSHRKLVQLYLKALSWNNGGPPLPWISFPLSALISGLFLLKYIARHYWDLYVQPIMYFFPLNKQGEHKTDRAHLASSGRLCLRLKLPLGILRGPLAGLLYKLNKLTVTF